MSFNEKDIDNIKIPENFDDRIKELVKTTYAKKKKRKKLNKNLGIACGLMLSFSGCFFMANPEYVEATVNKIREVFKNRNYNLVLEDGSESYNETYKVEHYGIDFEFDIDTSVPGIIKIKEDIDSDNIRLEDWKIKDDNINLDAISFINDDVWDNDKQQSFKERLYKGEDISSELESLENIEAENTKEYFENIIEYYNWGKSDEDFKSKNINANFNYKINGEEFYNNGGDNDLRIPEHLLGEKELVLEIEIEGISLANGYYAVKITNPEKIEIKLKSTKGKSSIKYIPIEYAYDIEGLRYTELYELIIYPDGRVDLAYDIGENKNNDYKITSFMIENEDGSKIAADGSVGKIEGYFGSKESIEGIWGLWRRVYHGEVTGNQVKITPVVTYNTDKNIKVEEGEEILNKVQSIVVKVK
ncbi:MAG: hypothetical protein ACRC57_11170 [Sarcina sp.]